MIDHVTFRVAGLDRSTAFYDRAFAPLGVRRLFALDECARAPWGTGIVGRGSGSRNRI